MSNLRRIRKQMGKFPRTIPSPPTGSASGPGVQGGPELMDIEMSELEAILERVKDRLSQDEYNTLHAVFETLMFMTEELGKKQVSIQRLKKLLFGATTEKTREILQQALGNAGAGSDTGKDNNPGSKPPKGKPPGHGRNGADAYQGAQKVEVSHPTLHGGDTCPSCKKGKVYETAEPGRLVRVHGQAPLGATVYELQKLRCNLCGEIFTAPTPPGVGSEKYDAESASMIALLKYGSGVPFNRLERLESSLGIPLPAATQWEIVRDMARMIEPVLRAMIHKAAQGQVLHNDDTTMKILELIQQRRKLMEAESAQKPDRTGVFTSGILSLVDTYRIALFFTGHHHAGENLVALLKQRASELGPPIQMCDALSRNVPAELNTILANCLTHGRRQFVDVAMNFPQECLYVLEILKDVYKNDAEAKSQSMSPEERLKWHQEESGPKMDELKTWMTDQIEQHKVEPNSGLGEAITYMLKHWEPLTLFLRVAGAPLDNNVCEAALKKAILHRKNSYFYKTQNGARVGDLFMSLIHTCELNKLNAFEYLTALQKNVSRLTSDPDAWLPWNYRKTLQTAAAR
jgi:transposase